MKKILVLAVLLLVAAGCNSTGNQNSNQNTNQQNTQPPASAPQTQTYKNGTYGFEFQYPADMVFVTPTYATLQDKIVQVQTGKSEYPKTNFDDAAFSVSAEYAKSLKDCLAIGEPLGAPVAGSDFKTQKQINGATFYYAEGSGAGAGNFYESRLYRTFSGFSCIELNETVHTSNIANFPSNLGITEVDKNEVWTKLDQILNSFKFAKDLQ